MKAPPVRVHGQWERRRGLEVEHFTLPVRCNRGDLHWHTPFHQPFATAGNSPNCFFKDQDSRFVQLARQIPPPANAMVPDPGNAITSWPDTLSAYAPGQKSYNCPSQRVPTIAVNTNTFGIGINYPDIGVYLGQPIIRDLMVAQPSATVAFADTSWIGNPAAIDPDLWTPTNQTSVNPWDALCFRTANNAFYASLPSRTINRHNGRCNTTHVDGHAESMKNSAIGLNQTNGAPGALWDRL